MRPTMHPDNLIELAALRLNLAPVPVGEAMFGMALARSVMAGVRLGVFASLCERPATSGELAERLGLDPHGTRLLLEALRSLGHVNLREDRYEIDSGARRWLDPRNESTYVGTFIENNFDYWQWWDRLEDIVRTGGSVEIHGFDARDTHWERYIRGQYELARLSAPEVAKALDLGKDPRRLLDVAGGHGWFSAELCRKYPQLHSTVVDLPGSAAIGRRIIAENDMGERVFFMEGDAFEADLGGPYDGALVFNLIHHFPPERNVELFKRIAKVLKPGGKLAVLDLFTKQKPDAGALLGLFFYLTSEAATYSPQDLQSWFDQAGFKKPKRVKIRRIPNQTLYVAALVAHS
ncbi:MAG: methyltransferase [Thermoleophilaceae bacterium]